MLSAMKKAAQTFKALADETRLRILSLLGEREICVCDLMTILELPQSTVSRHLAYLRHAGLVEDRRQGVWMYYRLADGDSLLHRDLLSLLRVRLAEIPQAEKDQAAMRNRLAMRDGKSCT